MPACTECTTLPDATDIGWKRHMTTAHGGFSKEQMDRAGVKASKGDEARFMGGAKTSAEVTSTAPDQEGGQPGNGPATGPAATTAAKPRKVKDEEEKRRAEAMEKVGQVLMRQLAGAPYTAWAALAADPNLQLTREELKEIADCYYLLAQTMQPDFSNKWWLIFAALGANVNAISRRVDLTQFMPQGQEEISTEENPDAEAMAGPVPAKGFFDRFRKPQVIQAPQQPQQPVRIVEVPNA